MKSNTNCEDSRKVPVSLQYEISILVVVTAHNEPGMVGQKYWCVQTSGQYLLWSSKKWTREEKLTYFSNYFRIQRKARGVENKICTVPYNA